MMRPSRLLPALVLAFTTGFVPARAQTVSQQEVKAAIAVIEQDVTSRAAVRAAEVVARFGRESDAVLITIGDETLPWMQADAPDEQATDRALLTAAYFAGDIKSQLARRRPLDDPYAGWMAAIRAYRQLRQKQPDLRIPEIEQLIDEAHTGSLRRRADELRRETEHEQQKNMI